MADDAGFPSVKDPAAWAPCPVCGGEGRGEVEGINPHPCSTCKGAGKLRKPLWGTTSWKC